MQPLWALLRVKDRARYMRRMAQAVIDDFDELVKGLAREQGRPAAEIAALELLPAIDALMWIAGSSSSAAISAAGRPCSRARPLTSSSKSSITAWAMRRM